MRVSARSLKPEALLVRKPALSLHTFPPSRANMVQQYFRAAPMVAISSPLQTGLSNRRRRVRHKIQTPAYATFTAESQGVMLDLHEIVNISEDGVAIQCHSPLEINQSIGLCLDLAGCPEQIFTGGQVVWVNSSGRAGLRFSTFPSDSLSRLREWLFVNAMAGVANSEGNFSNGLVDHPPTPNFTDTLAAISALQRQIEGMGSDFPGALQRVAERTQALLRASGAAIALADADPEFMVCRASAGLDAPPVSARLHVGSGFSGECVRKGVLLRCNDTELDPRVDRESCRALGIRSILATPVRAGEKSVGLIEALSSQPFAFSEPDERALQKLEEIVLESLARAGHVENVPSLAEPHAESFQSPQGSVLFASANPDETSQEHSSETDPSSITLPRSYLILLTVAAAAISLALGLTSAPWIQTSAAPWLMKKIRYRQHAQLQTVLASSKEPVTTSAPVNSAIEAATFDQLRQMAEKGNAEAQNALGLRYAQGDGVKLNEREAVRWFSKAAEQGNVAAQSKLGAFYYSGRGIPQDTNKAYFWMVVASLGGDSASNAQVPIVRARLTRAQVVAIEQQASHWLQLHGPAAKPAAPPKSS